PDEAPPPNRVLFYGAAAPRRTPGSSSVRTNALRNTAATRPRRSTTRVAGVVFGGTSVKPSATLPAGSNTLGYPVLCATRNACALSRSSRTSTPTNDTRSARLASATAASSSASERHGAHQD